MAILALLTTGLLMGLWLFLRRRSRLAYYLALGLLAVISLLTITDEFGLSDLIVLIITVAPLMLLIKDRAWYLQRAPGSPE
jgi:predicted membrane channel-forming protein YqfA (hemolysin III family)